MSEVANGRDYVYSIAASPDFARDGVCFVARQSGLYRYEANTGTWHNAYAALNLPDALVTPAVALSPNYASDHTVFAGTNGGVLRSEDGGENWVLGVMPKPPPVISAVVLSPTYVTDGLAFAGTMEDGLLRSPDRGTQWHRWNFGLLDQHILSLAVSPNFAVDGTVWVGADTGLFRSTNGGRSWRQLAFPGDLAPVICIAIAAGGADDGMVYAGTEAHGLYVSCDGGSSWSRRGEEVFPDVVTAVLVEPHAGGTPDVLVGTDERVHMSRDGGATWMEAPLNLSPGDTLSAMVAPVGLAQGSPLLIGTSSGQVIQVRIA
jgi:photosystem II stability/assembly factor-like uncharacterized protein